MKRIFVFISLALFFVSCNNNLINEDDSDSSVGKISMSIDMTQAPEDVMALSGVLSRTDFDSIFFDFSIENYTAEATIEDLQHGEWLLYVKAMDYDNQVLYDGSAVVEIIANKISSVSLQLDPVSTTGGIHITVTWGEFAAKQKMLFMAQNSADEWRVLSINLDGSNFQDIASGTHPFWMNDRNIIYFRTSTYVLSSYNLNNDEISTAYYIPAHGNFFRYSAEHDKIIFDYMIKDYNWHIGHYSLTSQEVTGLVTDSSWNKRPVPCPNSDWIYYQSDVSGQQQIYKVNYDGSEINQITQSATTYAGFPSFNKEGTKMLYALAGDGEYGLVKVALTDDNEQVIPFGNEVLYPTYSEDGNYIIYILVTGPAYEDREMFIMKTDGSDKKSLMAAGDYYDFARPITW